MLNKKVSDLLNEQINKELYSAYLYLDMNNYFDKRGLNGFANWYMIQAQEERDHAMLISTAPSSSKPSPCPTRCTRRTWTC